MDPTPRERDQFSKNPKPRECEATLECETTLNTRRVGSSCRRDERGKMGDEVVFFTKRMGIYNTTTMHRGRNYKISIDTKVKPTSVRTTKPLPLFRVQTDPAERLNPLPTWHSVQRVSLWGGGLLQQSVPHTSSSHGSSWMAFLSASDGRRVGLTASKMNYVLLCQPVVRDRDGSIRFNRRCFRQPRVVRSSSAC
mmetsp:Transcript_6128/g.13860  ORF Transcript_6128/g.13860 Transcript_6128/m.13860 type:complete len:195 (+) Transcript_6128:432-1016(+)